MSCVTQAHPADSEYTKFILVRLAVVEKSRGLTSRHIRFEVEFLPLKRIDVRVYFTNYECECVNERS